MTYRGPLARAVGEALAADTGDKRDAGTVALAKRYAALIDDAAPAAKYREPLEQLAHALSLLGMVAEDGALVDRADKALAKVTDALSAHSVASDLGPKLLAALTALGLTPAARGAKGGDQVVPATTRPESAFERLRRERIEREQRAREHAASPVDTAAP